MHICIHEPGKYTIQEAPKELKPNFSHADSDRTIPAEDALGRRIWNPDAGPVYWKLETDYPYIEGRKLEIKAIKKMFIQPSLLTELVIRQKKRSTADAEIVINFFDSKTEPIFKTNPNYLAFAYGPGPGIGGDITFNADRIWTLQGKPITAIEAFEAGIITGYSNANNRLRTWDVQHTGTHEGLHTLGCNHLPGCKECVIYPYYNRQRLLQKGDKDLLWSFYEKSSYAARLKYLFLSKVLPGVIA